jgi:hypothetical protein
MSKLKQEVIIFGIYTFFIICSSIIFRTGNISIIYFNFSPLFMILSIVFSLIFVFIFRIFIFAKLKIEFPLPKLNNIKTILFGINYSWLSILCYIFLLVMMKIPTESIRFFGLVKIINVFLFVLWNLITFYIGNSISQFLKMKINNERNGEKESSAKIAKHEIAESKFIRIRKDISPDPFDQYLLSKSNPNLSKQEYKLQNLILFFVALLWSLPILFMHHSVTPFLVFLWVYVFIIEFLLLKSQEIKGTWFAYSFTINFWLIIPWI